MNKGFALLTAVTVIAMMTCGCGGTDNSSQNSYSSTQEQSSVTESAVSDTQSSVQQTATAEQIPQEVEPQPGQSTEVTDISDQDIREKDIREQIVQTVQSLVGIDFATGGTSPDTGFDNSGLIYYVLRENGYINCPRATYDQKNMGTRIGIDELQPGDLVFFVDKDTDDTIGFGGIYIGENKLIYSPYPGEKVKYADLTGSYWRNNFDCAVRVF